MYCFGSKSSIQYQISRYRHTALLLIWPEFCPYQVNHCLDKDTSSFHLFCTLHIAISIIWYTFCIGQQEYLLQIVVCGAVVEPSVSRVLQSTYYSLAITWETSTGPPPAPALAKDAATIQYTEYRPRGLGVNDAIKTWSQCFSQVRKEYHLLYTWNTIIFFLK